MTNIDTFNLLPPSLAFHICVMTKYSVKQARTSACHTDVGMEMTEKPADLQRSFRRDGIFANHACITFSKSFVGVYNLYYSYPILNYSPATASDPYL